MLERRAMRVLATIGAAALGAAAPLLDSTIAGLRARRDAVRAAAERERQRLAAAVSSPADPPPEPHQPCALLLERSGNRDTWKLPVLVNGRPYAMVLDTGA